MKRLEMKHARRFTAACLTVCLLAASVFAFPGMAFAAENTNTGSAATTAAAVAAGSGALSIADVAERTVDAVVEISTESVKTNYYMQQYISEGAGSGVIIRSDGYIVTNNHVIDGASKITVRLRNGTTYEAKLIGTDAQTDVALLKIEASGLTAASFGDSGSLRVGETAIAIGNPLGQLGGTVTAGIISALDRAIKIDGRTMNLLQTDAAINPGNSGGGLFNDRAELIGIVAAKSSGVEIEGLGFAIPINDAKTVIEQLISYGYVKGRVDLGMTFMDANYISGNSSYVMFGNWNAGAYVEKVAVGSNAEKAGFRAGDRIVAIGDTKVSSSAQITQLLEQYKVGDTVTFTVARNGQVGTLTLQLAEYSPL